MSTFVQKAVKAILDTGKMTFIITPEKLTCEGETVNIRNLIELTTACKKSGMISVTEVMCGSNRYISFRDISSSPVKETKIIQFPKKKAA